MDRDRRGDTPDLFEYAARRAARDDKAPDDETEASPPPEADRATPAGGAPAAPGDRPVLGSREAPVTVTQLVRKAGRVMEKAFGSLWVEGEIASLSRPASGHVYFVLEDERCEARAVMWRADARRLAFRLEQGMAVRCRVRPSVFEKGGKFQLYVSAVEPSGVGAAALALEQLKKKLAAEGLFERAKKRPLPVLPRRIGVVTSKSGAAVRDIIRATQRRFPVPILIADAAVQGRGAPERLTRALAALCRCDVDVVIIGRGGGSSSDLSAFNDETLVRAVAACPVPIISAVGHEIDTSLTDLAADHRAATPTMAGEMAVPVLADLSQALTKEERRLRRELDVRFASARQELDGLIGRAEGHLRRRLHSHHRELDQLRRRLDAQHPKARLVADRASLGKLEERAHMVMQRRLERGRRDLGELAGRLSALSPLQVLERGYALVTAAGEVVKSAAAVSPGDAIDIRLASGQLRATVRAPADETGEGGEG